MLMLWTFLDFGINREEILCLLVGVWETYTNPFFPVEKIGVTRTVNHSTTKEQKP